MQWKQLQTRKVLEKVDVMSKLNKKIKKKYSLKIVTKRKNQLEKLKIYKNRISKKLIWEKLSMIKSFQTLDS